MTATISARAGGAIHPVDAPFAGAPCLDDERTLSLLLAGQLSAEEFTRRLNLPWGARAVLLGITRNHPTGEIDPEPLARAAVASADALGVGGTVTTGSWLAWWLIPLTERIRETAAANAGRRLWQRQARAFPGLTVAASRVLPITSWPEARDEVERILELASRRNLPAGFHAADANSLELRLSHLRSVVHDRAAIVEDLLSEIASDGPGNHGLMAVLEAHTLNGQNTASTAETLNIHVNTVRYRLRRVRELTGLDLADPLHRFLVELYVRTR